MQGSPHTREIGNTALDRPVRGTSFGISEVEAAGGKVAVLVVAAAKAPEDSGTVVVAPLAEEMATPGEAAAGAKEAVEEMALVKVAPLAPGVAGGTALVMVVAAALVVEVAAVA